MLPIIVWQVPAQRSTRYFFWIGNYQPVADGAWNACVSGEAVSYTSWSPTHVTPAFGAQPDDGANKGPAEDCAAITADGWYDNVRRARLECGIRR